MWSFIVALALTLPGPGGDGSVSGNACMPARNWQQVPLAVRTQFEATIGVGRTADVGEQFNATDLLMGDLPLSRFFAACHEGPNWTIAIERGGRGRHFETFEIRGGKVESKGKSLEPPTIGTPMISPSGS